MRRRALRVRPGEIVGRYALDRFTGISPVTVAALRRCEDAAFASAKQFAPCMLSPLAPFALHSSLATVDQNKVVTTTRGNEVAADPTATLVLEAAIRRIAILRQDAKSTEVVRLAASQRVVRAQQVTGPRQFAHFHLFGLVSGGRDTGSRQFESEAVAEHLEIHVNAALALGASQVRIALTDFSGRDYTGAIGRARERLDGTPGVICEVDDGRVGGRGYYRDLCFKSHATFGADTFEIGDGGVVDWTQQLTSSGKERCFISGIGLDRIALAL